GTITARGDFDNRTINPVAQPRALHWPLTVHLQEGWSAGAVVWCDPAGQKGYAIRLDARQNKLALEKIGAWPEVQEIDYFPWSFLNSNKVNLRIETGQNYIRVFAPDVSKYAILEALNVEPEGPHIGLQIYDAK